jgi:large subunit ribosomal protein L28
MAHECDYCDKATVFGRQYEMRGKPKYLGGNGRKTTGITPRVFKPNLQRVQVQEGGSVVTRRVCVKCIRDGKVTKAVVRKPFTIQAES